MSRRPPPERVDEPLRWLRGGKLAPDDVRSQPYNLGALTGQDTRALLAIAACWRLYFGSDDDGQQAAIGAIRQLLRGMQSKCWIFAKRLIPQAGDWSHEDPVWRSVVEGDALLTAHFMYWLHPELP